MIYEDKKGPKCYIQNEVEGQTSQLSKLPDFTKMSSNFRGGNRIVDDCIVLAGKYKREDTKSYNEADFEQFLGLEIKPVPNH